MTGTRTRRHREDIWRTEPYGRRHSPHVGQPPILRGASRGCVLVASEKGAVGQSVRGGAEAVQEAVGIAGRESETSRNSDSRASRSACCPGQDGPPAGGGDQAELVSFDILRTEPRLASDNVRS
jgi:hypothetical protein